MRALKVAEVLDREHQPHEVHSAFRAVRHELLTLRDLHLPEAIKVEVPELASAHAGRATQPGTLRHRILAALSVAPLADFQARDALASGRPNPDWPRIGQVQRRRHELMAAGWVERTPSTTGGKYTTAFQEATGRQCTVYRLTTAGFAALSRLRSGQTVLFADSALGNGSAT